MPAFDNPYNYLEINSQIRGEEIAVGSLRDEITWTELKSAVDHMSSKLRFLGIKPGQIVTILGENIFLWKLQLALMKLGAITTVLSTPIVPGYLQNELLVTDRKFKTNAHKVIVIDETWMKDAFATFKSVPVEAGYKNDEPFRFVLTSGTTGTPKAVVNNYQKFLDRIQPEGSAWDIAQPELSMMGFSASVGFWAAVRSLIGGHVFVSVTGATGHVADLVQKYQIKSITASPAQLQGEMKNWSDSDPRLISLEKVMSSGSVMSNQVIAQLKKKLSAPLFTRFGSTEAGGISERELGDISEDEKWIGHMKIGSAAKIVDQNDNEIVPGEIGQLMVKSSSMSSGYWKNPVETAKRFRDGWFETGDLAFKTSDGKIILSARDSQLINMGGVKVDPDRIDLIISGFPDVLDCGTFALRRSNGQVLAVSMVRVTSNDQIEKINNYLRAKLGSGRPKLVLPVKEIPRNANGKLDRNALEKLYSKRVEEFILKNESLRN